MKITTITNIELSSVCDNRCAYCPAPVQHKYREIGFINEAVFRQALSWVRYFSGKGTQRELNLFGIGEPTLHPEFIKLLDIARKVVPLRVPIHLNTNGNNITDALVRQIQATGINEIDITAHKPFETVRTIRIFEKHGVKFRVSFDPILAPNNWAGQVDWFEPNYPKPYPCPWLNRGQVMVMSDGQITTCCLDAFGKGIIGDVYGAMNEMEVAPFKLCETCHHTR